MPPKTGVGGRAEGADGVDKSYLPNRGLKPLYELVEHFAPVQAPPGPEQKGLRKELHLHKPSIGLIKRRNQHCLISFKCSLDASNRFCTSQRTSSWQGNLFVTEYICSLACVLSILIFRLHDPARLVERANSENLVYVWLHSDKVGACIPDMVSTLDASDDECETA